MPNYPEDEQRFERFQRDQVGAVDVFRESEEEDKEE